ncbi:MAG: hypothetical protein JEY91_12395 [Spirochaetaceae bacterium]|nr:hypothetical protein [Spirochaetaceae bacterium]
MNKKGINGVLCLLPLLLAIACDVGLTEMGIENPGNNVITESELYNASDDDNTELIVSSVEELMNTAQSTKSGNMTVLIADGTYILTDRLWITGENVTYRSQSGIRENVILKGKGMNGSIGYIFSVAGSDFTAKDLTIGEVAHHGIQVHGELDADNLNIINVHFIDINEQNIKGSYDKNNIPENHSDNGLVEHCLFEYSAGIANQYYCGGIDVHHGENWVVRNNTFKNIISPVSQLTEGAIHFWTESKNTTIESNRIVNCDRGIMLGFDSTAQYGGIIANNMIQVVRDTGIYLARAESVKVYNNSVFLMSNYPNAIEYRFGSTAGVVLENNLTNKPITSRDGAVAEVKNNLTNAASYWFSDVGEGNLHLSLFVDAVVDKGSTLGEVPYDIDKESRTAGFYDIGADEWNH